MRRSATAWRSSFCRRRARRCVACAGVLAWPGPAAQPDEALALLDRELELSSPGERAGLQLPRCELLRVQGQLSDARVAYQEVLGTARAGQKVTAKPGVLAALSGLVDVAIAQQAAGDLLPALDSVLELYAPHGTLRTALMTERARLDELGWPRQRRDGALRSGAGRAEGQARRARGGAGPPTGGEPAAQAAQRRLAAAQGAAGAARSAATERAAGGAVAAGRAGARPERRQHAPER